MTYTPTTAADWDSDADPGDVDNALDQLAERVEDLEGAISRVLISEQSPSGTGMVTFSSIPGTYHSLEMEIVGRSTRSANDDAISIQFNADTTASHYRRSLLNAYGITVAKSQSDDSIVGYLAAANAPSGSCGSYVVKISDYAGTTFNKQVNILGSMRFDSSSLFIVQLFLAVEWENTAAITPIVILLASGNYVSGTSLRFYGLN